MVVGKISRTKNWVAGQKIESFSDLEAGSSDDDEDRDSGSEDGSVRGKAAANGTAGKTGMDDDQAEQDALDPASDWDTFEEQARRAIATSKTSVRLHFLIDVLSPHLKRNSLTPQQVSIILKLLISTYPRYIDSRSRDAVLSCVSRILVNDLSSESSTKGKLAENLIKWLENEVTTKVCSPKSTAAGATVFSILCWASTIFSDVAKATTSDGKSVAEVPATWTSVMRSLATCYDYLLASTSAKRSMKKTGTKELRRTFRGTHKLVPKALQYLATTSDVKPPTTVAPLLGLVIDVALHLRPRKKQPADYGKQIVISAKDLILKYYRENILASRQALPSHTLTALDGFVSSVVAESDLAIESELVKAMDRALLRTPELALPTIDSFFQSYTSLPHAGGGPFQQRPPPSDLFKAKLLPAILSASKSSNPLIRSASALLLSTLAPSLFGAGESTQDVTVFAVKEFCTPLKTLKSASPDHRVTLCELIQAVFTGSRDPPVEALKEASEALCTSLLKEANEAALKATTSTLVAVTARLPAQEAVALNSTATILCKGMQDSKSNVRRIYVGAAGEILWQHSQTSREGPSATNDFVEALIPGFEAALKNASNSPVTSAPDGWIAIAVLKGPLTFWKMGNNMAKAAAAQNVLSHGAKPSFLLSEKLHRKFVDPEDELWLVRALEMLLTNEDDMQAIMSDTSLQAAITAPLFHLATESTHYPSRRAALQCMQSVGTTYAEKQIPATLFVEGLAHALLVTEKHDALQASTSDDYFRPDRSSRLQAIIAAVAAAGKASDEVLVQLLVPCHHELVGNTTSWVDAIISASKDPAVLAGSYSQTLLSQIWQYTQTESLLFRNAAYASLSTLAFVSPQTIIPDLLQRVVSGLAPSMLDFIGPTEIGIYKTPIGQTFVDGADKPSTVAKGRNAAMDKWDQETRAALAKKKASQGTPTLSKAEKALVDEQLAKEATIRVRVTEALARVHQSLRVIRSLLSLTTEERDTFLPQMTSALLQTTAGKNCTLFAEEAFQTVLRLYETCSPRLSDVRLSLALAVLRSQGSAIVPDDFAVEDLAALIARVLYRVRFQSEKEPFEPSTFAMVYPLLAQCIAQEGAGIGKDDSDTILEQLTLTIDIFSFHTKRFGSLAYPRRQSIASLIVALAKFPSLGRQISEALAGVGEAIAANSSKVEQEALLDGLMVDEAQVRLACLQALSPLDLTEMDYSNELWIAVQDAEERNAQLASHIWDENGLDVNESILPTLLQSLAHASAFVRSSSALAISEAVAQMPETVAKTVELLSRAYKDAARERMPEYDQYGMLVEESLHQQDPWQERVAIAETFGHLAPLMGSSEVAAFFRLLIDDQGLGDRSEIVRSNMLQAGIAVVDVAGKDNLQSLMDTFQAALSVKSGGSEVQDRVIESVIVLLGRLASFLKGDDPRMLSVIDRLLVALHTPSELVQDAVSECLPPLVRANRDKGSKIIEQLLRETLHAKKYAERRGAAYGLAGAIKGRGVTAFREFDIITRLSDAAEDKKDAEGREGAMFAFETMSAKLGRLFEPYISRVIPLLLNCLGDSNPAVRQATSDAARVLMSKVSGHGVKLLLPSLLDALEDRQWRTKKGAIELMGNMAYLAPRQLSISLPTIIPPLTEVLTDTHAQVRASANASLKKFGDVVDNPEIKAMQSTLLGALVDPTNKTLKALNALLTTSFVHYIDPSSLALIIPIIDRGLRERSAELKRKGAQIVGNLASLTDSKDIIAYLPQLIPRVREVLVDPVPEARATAAKSLGVLIERLGEDAFPTLVDGLIETLKTDMSGVDQQGAAQGLSEVLAGLGVERMEKMLPDIISYTSSPRAYIREGFISLLIYLPSVFGDRFAPYLGRIIQPVLSGLADESEFVREASMRAGRMIVNNHSAKAIDLLLPELERGLFDQSWRIRLSSIQLVGELLFKLSGISGKAEFEEENAAEEEDAQPSNSEAARKMLDTLGREKRDRVLASLYVLRQDSAGQVRLFSINVWKVLVANTPRTTREILPSLMQIIIRLLSSPSEDLREMVARTLAELCRKQGDRIMGEIIPILQQASKGSVAARQGCCLAFAEMLDATNKTQLEGHEDSIIESVRSALVDDEPSVRQAAALAFDALQNQLGPRSIDQTIPTLLNALTAQGAASDAALSALQELMSVRAHAIFPILIPTLIAQPISAFNAQALAALVTVAGDALNRRLSQILDALQKSAENEKDEETKAALDSAIRAVLASVHDTDGLHMLMLHLLGLAKDPRAAKRTGGCDLFASFCQVTEEDFSAYHVDWLRQILSLFDDSEPAVVEAAGRAMDAFSKTLTKEQMEGLSVALRRTIESLGSPGSEIAGFGRPGGLKPVLPILIQGLLAGTNEQREQSAFALGDIVERTAVDSLKPYVTQITGPLIRIIAERYPAPVKAAILSTLSVLLRRVPQFVRPFFPQLQRTFVKNLSDMTSSTVRSRAATGLGVLMGLQPRIDPLITELVNNASHEEQEVREAMVNALGAVVASGGANMSPPARDLVANLVSQTFEEPSKDAYNAGVARTLAGMVLHSMPQAEPLLSTVLETKATQFSAVCMVTLLEIAPEQLYNMVPPSKVVGRILKNVISDAPGVARPAREARELLKKTAPWSEDEEIQARLA